MRDVFTPLLLLIAFSARASEQIEITGASKSVTIGESHAIQLVHPVIRATVFLVEHRAHVMVRRGVMTQFCPSADRSERITSSAELFPGCMVEIAGGTSGTIVVDGTCGSFDVRIGASLWLKFEHASQGAQ